MTTIAPQLYRAGSDWNDNTYTDWQGVSAMFDAWQAEDPEYRTWDTSTDDTLIWGEFSPEFGVSIGAIDYDRDEMGGWSLYSVPFEVPGLDAFEGAER